MTEESLEKKNRNEYRTGGQNRKVSMNLGCLDQKRRWNNDKP